MNHPVQFFFRDHKSYRQLAALSVATFLFGVIYGLFSFYLPIYTENVVKSVAVVGVLLAVIEVSGLLVDLPLGAFTDRYGRRNTLLLGSLLLGVSALFLQSWQSFLGILAALVFYGVVLKFFLISSQSELMSISPRRRSGKFFGIFEAFHNFGYSIGPFLGGFLLWQVFPPVFLVLAAICAILFLFSLIFIESSEYKKESFLHTVRAVIKKDHFFVGSVAEFKKVGFLGWMLLLFFFTFSFRWGAIALLEPLFTLKLGIHPVWVGFIYGASTLPFLFFSASAGNFSDRYGIKPGIVVGLFLMGVATLLFGMYRNPYVLFAFAFLAAIGDSVLVPTVYAAFDTLSDRHFKGRITSVVSLTEDTGYFFGPLIAGPIAQYFGFPAAFYCFGILILLVALVAIIAKIK